MQGLGVHAWWHTRAQMQGRAHVRDVLRHDEQELQSTVVNEALEQLAAHPGPVAAAGACMVRPTVTSSSQKVQYNDGSSRAERCMNPTGSGCT